MTSDDAAGRDATPGNSPASNRRLRNSVVTATAAVLTLGVTAALSVVCYVLNRHSEHRLLDLQVKQTATVLQALLPGIETPLASAAELAVTNRGSAESFRSYMSSYVGKPPSKLFAGASLWHVSGATARKLAASGRSLALPATPGRAQRTLAATTKGSVMLVGPLDVSGPTPRLGYAYRAGNYVVYVENVLPKGRYATIQRGSPFSDLRFALYVGRSTTDDALLETNVSKLPVPGDTAKVSVPFGSSALTLVAASDRQLGGALSAALWWIVIIVGVLLTGLITLITERLVRRREEAEDLTADAQVQLAAQRSLAKTLQQALLPESLPNPPGLCADARYVTGTDGVDIGGDWYDLLPLHDGRVFFVIGDVSGRGVPAGTTMAALRFAIHGFVHEQHPPATVLDHLVGMIDVARDGQFATILCGVLDVDRHEITMANAGHLPPLVIGDGEMRYIDVPTGPPIGVPRERPYQAVTVAVPPRATMLAFTDGLIERPGETLDESMEHLSARIGAATTLTDVFDRIVPSPDGVRRDDIAILGVQWLN